MAGRVQLAVTGIQDQWLTGDPQFSYFVTLFKRHTRFSTEAVEMPFSGDSAFGSSVECRIPTNIGDLVRGMTLKVKLGNLTSHAGVSSPKYFYNVPLGKSIIKYADLVIGGQVIERLTGEYIYMYDQLHSNKDDVNQTLYFMNGHNQPLTVSDTYNTFYINLPFYFHRNPSLAVPVCALTKQLVEVRVTFRDVDDDVTFKYTKPVSGDMNGIVQRDKTTEGSIKSASLITDFYFITEDEKNFLLTRPMEYVITQLQKSTIQFKPGELKKSVMLNFENPVKELLFLAKEETGFNFNSTQVTTPGSIAQLGQTIDGDDINDLSGGSVAMSSDGTRVAIGAEGVDSNGDNSGHVRVYDLIGSTWTQVGQDIDGEAESDSSGSSVAMSSDGTRVAIGAILNDGQSGSVGHDSGHVRVYDLIGSTWTQVGQDIDGEFGDDESGYSVTMSSDGTRIAVGAPTNGVGGSSYGHVRVYDLIGSTWTQVGQDIDGENAGDRLGVSVAMSADGSRVAIGAYLYDSYRGRVEIYDYIGSSWTLVGSSIPGEVANDQFGWSVAMSSDGSRVAIGAKYNDGGPNNSGHVRVYQYSGSQWNKIGQDIEGENNGGQSGYSVAMSSDGSRVAIGAPYNDAGQVRVYDLIGSTWTQAKKNASSPDIDGDVAGDRFGYSIAMSADGSRVAIGAILSDVPSNSGHTRVFNITTEVIEIIYEDRLLNTSTEWTAQANLNGASDQSFADAVLEAFDPSDNLNGAIRGGVDEYNTKRSDHRALKNIKLECNGATVFDHSGQYLAYQQSLRYHTGCPDPAYEFYTYSFALKPEVYYPTGQLNMSRIIHKKLDIELDTIPTATSGTTTATKTRNINVGVYAHSYNVLHIESGLAGLKF
jgi:hypothetical protein